MLKLYLMKKYLLFVLPGLLTFIISNAQSTGPIFPTTYATSGQGAGWGNLVGVQYVDNSPAYVDLAQFPTCNNFMCYYSNVASFSQFNFAIPGGSTITGIQIDMLQRVSSPGGGIHDSVLVLSLNGIPVGNIYVNPNNWSDVPTVYTYGGATDSWGSSWTAASINDPTFGFMFQVTNSSYNQPASVDHLTMTIYFQTGTGVSSQTSSPVFIGIKDNFLQILSESSNYASGGKVEIMNMAAQILFEASIENGQKAINVAVDTQNWNNGIYMVNLYSNAGSFIQRKVVLMDK